MAKTSKKEIFKRIRLDLIDRPKEIARLEIKQDELKELAKSISERGLMQPIEVTPRGDRYLIVFGDRRYLAHKMLMKKEIICRIEEIDDEQVVVDRAMENVQRVDLTPFEEGNIYAGLKEKAGMSLEEISNRVGKSPGTVQRRIDILRMPDSFQKALHEKTINVSVAEELWSCPDAVKREYFLELAVEHGITKDIAREWVQDFKKELRNPSTASEDGIPSPMEYEESPIFRACDLCRGPVEYKDLKEMRLCPQCFGMIVDAKKGK